MKTKIIAIVSLLLGAALVASCSVIPGLGSNTPPSTPVGPINANYANAVSPVEQLILGTMNLQGNLAITPDEAAKLLPYWEAYQTLATSNSAAPEELQAALVGAEQAMTPAQVQAIVNMKLTRQDMGTILQQQGLAFGGARGAGTPRAGGFGGGGGFRGGGGFGGGIPGIGGGPGGFGGGGFRAGSTPNSQAIGTLRARASSGAANAGLVRLLIRFLQEKNPALMPSATPAAATSPAPVPSETPTP